MTSRASRSLTRSRSANGQFVAQSNLREDGGDQALMPPPPPPSASQSSSRGQQFNQSQLPLEQSLQSAISASGDHARYDPKRIKIVKFTGNADDPIKIQSWLKLFHVATVSSRTDTEKIAQMMSHLAGEALNFFASDVADQIGSLTWNDVTEKFVQRFGREEVSPLLSAFKRRLQKNEAVQTYFDAKMQFLSQTELIDKSKVALLTDGMPPSYRGALISAKSVSPLEWLCIAKSLEEANKYQFRQSNNSGSNTGSDTATALVSSAKNSNKVKPPRPCKICKALNKTEWHWHNECPNRSDHPTSTKDSKSEATALAASGEALDLNMCSGQCSH